MEQLEDILTEVGNSIDIEDECHDCGQPIKVKVTLEENKTYLFEAQGGAAQYAPKIEGKIVFFYKCPYCYRKAPTLKDWNPTEVYTRVVGYYRPISSFNKGKQEEYKHRQNFSIDTFNGSQLDTFNSNQNLGEFE